MIKKTPANEVRHRRHQRIRKKLSGSADSPRLCIFRSQKHIYAQVIDDTQASTLVAASSLDEIKLPKESAKPEAAKAAPAEAKGKKKEGAKQEKPPLAVSKPFLTAKAVGELVAKRALEKGIKRVVFDRAGFKFHGRVKAVADGAREAGLEF